MKKLLSVLLVFVLMLALFSVAALATKVEDTEACPDVPAQRLHLLQSYYFV